MDVVEEAMCRARQSCYETRCPKNGRSLPARVMDVVEEATCRARQPCYEPRGLHRGLYRWKGGPLARSSGFSTSCYLADYVLSPARPPGQIVPDSHMAGVDEEDLVAHERAIGRSLFKPAQSS